MNGLVGQENSKKSVLFQLEETNAMQQMAHNHKNQVDFGHMKHNGKGEKENVRIDLQMAGLSPWDAVRSYAEGMVWQGAGCVIW